MKKNEIIQINKKQVISESDSFTFDRYKLFTKHIKK